MSNAIRFLETLGQDPALSRLPKEQLKTVVDSLELDAAQRDALLAGDPAALGQLIGGRARMIGLIWEPGPEIPPDGTPPDCDVPDQPAPGEESTPEEGPGKS